MEGGPEVEQLELTAEKRDVGKGVARRLRREGYVPAVVYGRDIEGLPLRIDAKDFQRITSAGARNALIKLRVKGDRKRSGHTVMLKEVQRDPIKGDVLHADLYQVSLEQKITTRVPVALVGSDAVERSGGVLQHHLREIEVECLPTEIPERFTLDVSGLEIGDRLSVADLEVSDAVKVLAESNEVVCAVVAPRAIEEEEVEAEEPEEGLPEEGAPAEEVTEAPAEEQGEEE